MDRPDLGELLARAARRVIDAERPLLEAHGVSMWAYVALSLLARGSTPTQLALAESMGYDKTRLIKILDGLEADGLVAREPDPSDRRARVVSLTAAGRAKHAAIQADIHAMEDEVLASLSATERATLYAVLPRLA
ncbi:MarR family transcriptional regulator [Solirubrobacter phytolaccae]|uniref:MarR family transcriptional regulator n=1 Tax=Solirubrobacter phytolaccae TaxID=1404360 RepID=A0A9X3N815_9ACTN|nr:MarR family transcriptional regulator [Solirubrobacter phytolaccae]MDA0179962.1 MarR family transcriptional regulator [Solirubrobacter phytolaccae]